MPDPVRIDYAALASVAVELVTLFGAPAVAVIPGTAQSGQYAFSGDDPGGDQNVAIELAITDFEDAQIDGDYVRRTDKAGWTFPPATGENLRYADRVKVGNVSWKIQHVEVIQPAATVVAYRFTLRR